MAAEEEEQKKDQVGLSVTFYFNHFSLLEPNPSSKKKRKKGNCFLEIPKEQNEKSFELKLQTDVILGFSNATSESRSSSNWLWYKCRDTTLKYSLV